MFSLQRAGLQHFIRTCPHVAICGHGQKTPKALKFAFPLAQLRLKISHISARSRLSSELGFQSRLKVVQKEDMPQSRIYSCSCACTSTSTKYLMWSCIPLAAQEANHSCSPSQLVQHWNVRVGGIWVFLETAELFDFSQANGRPAHARSSSLWPMSDILGLKYTVLADYAGAGTFA